MACVFSLSTNMDWQTLTRLLNSHISQPGSWWLCETIEKGRNFPPRNFLPSLCYKWVNKFQSHSPLEFLSITDDNYKSAEDSHHRIKSGCAMHSWHSL